MRSSHSLRSAVPVLGFAARSGTGKTTLLVRLLPLLTGRGLRVGVIKHAHHRFDIDHPGKDSYELRKAGAEQIAYFIDAILKGIRTKNFSRKVLVFIALKDWRKAGSGGNL